MEKRFNPNVFSGTELRDKGAWVFGQDIVKNLLIPQDSDIQIPQHFYIPLKDQPERYVEKAYAYGKPFSVKYSLHGDAFSPFIARGSNSSRDRRLPTDSISKSEALRLVKEYILRAPHNCSGLVLQELINQSGGCLLHAELSSEEVEVELLWERSTGRVYSRYSRDHGLIEYEAIEGEGEPSNREESCEILSQKFMTSYQALARNYGDVSWSIEGFWHLKMRCLQIFQLRPTPNDRFTASNKHVTDSLYRTNFVWGDFQIGSINISELQKNGKSVSQSIYLRRTRMNETMEKAVINRLNSGIFTLLVDPYRGFRLSHEKWFLPPSNLRHMYGFMHIPEKVIHDIVSKKVSLVSSAGCGYIVPSF